MSRNRRADFFEEIERIEQVLNQLSAADRAAALRGLELLARAANDQMRSISRRTPL